MRKILLILIWSFLTASTCLAVRGNIRWSCETVKLSGSENVKRSFGEYLYSYSFGTGRFFIGPFGVETTVLEKHYGELKGEKSVYVYYESYKYLFDNYFDSFFPVSFYFVPSIVPSFGGWLYPEFFLKGSAWAIEKTRKNENYDYSPSPSFYINGGVSFVWNPLKFLPLSFKCGLLWLRYPKSSEFSWTDSIPESDINMLATYGTLEIGLGYTNVRYSSPEVTSYLLCQDNNRNEILEPREMGILILIIKTTSPLNNVNIKIEVSPSSYREHILLDSAYKVRSILDWKEKKIEIPIYALDNIPTGELKIMLKGTTLKGNELFKAKTKIQTDKPEIQK